MLRFSLPKYETERGIASARRQIRGIEPDLVVSRLPLSADQHRGLPAEEIVDREENFRTTGQREADRCRRIEGIGEVSADSEIHQFMPHRVLL
jgi:hypothetical protein